MSSFTWILISIGIVVILLGVVALILKRKEEMKMDYYMLFIMGIIWMPLGFALGNYALSVMGIVLLIIGLMNKDKWEENKRTCKTMNCRKRWLILLLSFLGAFVLAALIAFWIIRNG